MKHWRKKILCIICALMMMVSIIQIPVSASTTPSTVTVAQAEARLDTLISKFKGKYFTVNGTYCTVGSHSSEHDNCLMSKVVATSWVKNLVGMGTLDPSLFPAQYNYDGSKWSVDGWQCYGFANFAHWYIFAQKNTDNLVSTLVTKGAMTYTTLKNALPGDVIRTDWLGGHSMVFVSCDSSGFTVLDCNYKDSATGNYACQVKVHKVSYNSSYSVGITGVSNYDRSSKTIAVTGVSVSSTSVSLDKGNTYTLSASVSPSNATNKTVTWSSNNTAVATVSSAGVVTGVGPGTATITATTKDGGYKATCAVTVSGDAYTITYDLNGGSWYRSNTQTKNEGQDLTLVDEVPTRSGFTFLGWESSNAIVTEGEWTTEKPAEGEYETGYKYYTYGYEYASDYTYAYGPNKNTVWSSSLGTYSAAKLRYFWLIESTNHGESFFPAKTGNTASNFNAPYISETGVTGTATIRNTNFYFESVVYKQDLVKYPVYQPGETLTRDENVTLSAIWSYNETSEGQATDDRLTGIELISLPDKLNYKAYYYLELDGAVLRLHFADGEYEDIILDRPFSYLNNRGYYYSEHLQEIFTISLGNTRYKVAGNYTASVLAFGHKATFGVTIEELNETYTITNLKNSYTRDTADDNVLIIEALQEDGSAVKMTILGYEMPNEAPGIIITDQGVISGCFDIKDSRLSLSLHFDGDPYSGYGYTCGTSNSVGSYNYYTTLMYANKIRESWRGDDHYSGTITKANIDGIVETVILLDDADFATSYSGSYIRSLIQKYFGIEADLSLSEKYDASTDVYNGGPWYGDASGATKYQMPIMLQYHLFGDHGIPDWEYTYEFYDHWNNTLVVSQEISIKFDFYKTISEYHRSHPIFNANHGELEIYTTQSNVRPNQTFDVYLRLTAPIIANKLNIGTTSILYDTPLWDTESLELIDYEWLLDDTVLTDWNTDTQSGTATFQENMVIDGSVLKLTFRVKESAMAGPTHVGAVIRGYAMDGNTEDFHLSSERFASVTVDLTNSMIVRKGSTLEYTDLIYVKHVFDLMDIDLTKVDLSKDAGILYWTQEEFAALDGIIYDPDHALVGLSLYPGTNFYYGRSEGIFTRDLAEEHYYVGYVKLPDGTYIYSEPLLYGPQTYAYNMLGKDTTSQATKQLCVALLNYIAAAQQYFYPDITDSELANAGLTAEQKTINWTNAPENFTLAGEIPENKKIVADKSVFTRSGKNLRFEDMISLISVYQISDSIIANAEECGTIFWTAEQFAALNGTPSIDNIGSGQRIAMESYGSANMWCSVAPKVAAKDMADTSYYILGYVKHRDGTVSYSDVMSYSFEQYIYNKVTDVDTSEEMLEFAKRLYVYEREARNALLK